MVFKCGVLLKLKKFNLTSYEKIKMEDPRGIDINSEIMKS